MKSEITVLDDVKKARIFMSPTRGEIMKELAVQPRSISQLARTLGISPPAVHYHIRILEKAGLITVTRVETVRNNLVEKFYASTSPCFMVIGEETSRNGPVPPKGRQDKVSYVARIEGTEEYLSEFDLRLKEGCKCELEESVLRVMEIISSHAQEIGKGLFAQLDEGLSKAQRNKIESLAAALAPIALAKALDDREMIETLRSLKTMVEPM